MTRDKKPPVLAGPGLPPPYWSGVLLLSLMDDPENGRPVWIIELDGVLVGRFDSKDAVAVYLHGSGHRIDPDDEWPRHRLL